MQQGDAADKLVQRASAAVVRLHTGLLPDPNSAALLVTALAATSLTVGLVLGLRRTDQARRDRERVVYRLGFARSLTILQVEAFVRSLAILRAPRGEVLGRDSVVLEVTSAAGRIQHRLWISERRAEAVLAQLRATIPSVQVEEDTASADEMVDEAVELGLSDWSRPMRLDQPEVFAASLLRSLLPLQRGERLLYQLVIGPLRPRGRETRGTTTENARGSYVGRMLQVLWTGTRREADDRAAQDKRRDGLHAVALRIGARAGSGPRRAHLVGRLRGCLHQLEQPGVRLTARRRLGRRSARRMTTRATPIVPSRTVLNVPELAILLGWPVNETTVPGLSLRRGRVYAPALELPRTGKVIGEAVASSQARPVALAPADALMHMLVSGPTGSGKSTVLLNLIKQDLDAGHGLILIDPGGDLARDVLDRVPAARIDEVIYLDPTDERPVGLNPLAGPLEEVELRAERVLAALRERSMSWGPRLEELLRAGLVVLAARQLTLVELAPLLVDANARRQWTQELPAWLGAAEVWARFESWSEAEQSQAVAAVLNKLAPVVGRRVLRGLLGQTEVTWTMEEVIQENKVLIVALPSGTLGPLAADVVGGLVTNMVWEAALARQRTERAGRRPVMFYIDELARFMRGSGTDLADLLARARGHSLGLVGAVQHLDQLRPELRAAVLSEARNKIILQPAARDAVAFARMLPDVTPEDLLALEARTALAALVVGGVVVPPVTVRTLPPPEATGQGEAVRRASRDRYGRDREAVEAAIAERRDQSDPGRRRIRRTS
ncbi:type IV secretory system conjugative DNA transfer family protein [Streptosporangiaceae bacterium NEAU-GS5]|nr:type IV secretory system conjugative DNA transfer family protein [Streptosporangiaceae bacterium NEAU-GS5]